MIATHHPALETFFQFALFAVIILAVGVSAFFQSRRRDERVGLLMAHGERLKFDSFNARPDGTFMMGWGFLKHLSRGENRYAFNILRGSYHDGALFVFDYHYQTGSGKSEQQHYGTMLLLVMQEAFP